MKLQKLSVIIVRQVLLFLVEVIVGSKEFGEDFLFQTQRVIILGLREYVAKPLKRKKKI